MLATSTNTPLLMNTTTGPKLMMAADSEDHVIRSGAVLLQKTNGNSTSTNHEVHIENVRLGHQLYYIDTFFLNLKRLPMVSFYITPLSLCKHPMSYGFKNLEYIVNIILIQCLTSVDYHKIIFCCLTT